MSNSASSNQPPQPNEVAALIGIMALAFVLRVSTAVQLPNIHHPDEVFQYLEQGHRLAFGYGVVPWEYRAGIRLWVLPGFLGGLMAATSALGGGAGAYLVVIAVTLSLLSLPIVLVSWLWARRLAGSTAGLLAATIAATWFELVYFAAKPLTEVLACTTLFAAAYVLIGQERMTRLFAGGVLLGLTLVLRLHLAPAIAVVALAGCLRRPLAGWLVCAAGGAFMLAAAGALDWATWGQPFHSFWMNVRTNVLQDRASFYGTDPVYWYFGQYALIWSGFTVPLVMLAAAGAWRAPLLLIVPAMIVGSHSLIGHKEHRFVLPALPFVLLAAAIGTAYLVEGAKRAWPRFGPRGVVAAAVLAWVVTSVVLVIGERFRPDLIRHSAGLVALAELRDRPGLCGVGLLDTHWSHTGGYTWLHRDVALYSVCEPEDPDCRPQDLAQAFNSALAHKDAPLAALGFRQERCYAGDLCLFHREGPCTARPDRILNAELVRRDQ